MMKKLNIIIGLIILFAINFGCAWLVNKLDIAFPAPLLGMIILTVLIKSNIIPKNLMEDSCNLLLENIGLFFVPLLVGVVLYTNVIAKNLIPLSLNILISTVIVMCVTGGVVEAIIINRKRFKQ